MRNWIDPFRVRNKRTQIYYQDLTIFKMEKELEYITKTEKFRKNNKIYEIPKDRFSERRGKGVECGKYDRNK